MQRRLTVAAEPGGADASARKGSSMALGAARDAIGREVHLQSVYQRALGDEFGSLHPNLQRYFGPIPPGSVGTGSGRYRVAGSRIRLLRPVLAVMAWRHALFPDLGYDVPFGVTNVPNSSGGLEAVRTFDFASGSRIMQDRMTVASGCLYDRVGKRGGLGVALQLAVVSGGLRMRSTRLALHIGTARIPLPRFATVHLDERIDPLDPSRQNVDVRITAPLVGEIFRYAGTFTYALTPVSISGSPASRRAGRQGTRAREGRA